MPISAPTIRSTCGLMAVASGAAVLAWTLHGVLLESPVPDRHHIWWPPAGILASAALISSGFSCLLKRPGPSSSGPGERNLCHLFMETTQKILAHHPKIGYTLDVAEDGRRCTLTIPKRAGDGFDISVEATPMDITVSAEGWHTHVDFFEDAENVVLYSLALVRDLLSPHMRILLLCSGGHPYRCRAEVLKAGKWRRHSATGQVLWNYFGKRSVKVLQNRVLYGRLDTPGERP